MLPPRPGRGTLTCRRCGMQRRHAGRAYCPVCESQVRRAMARDDYLQELPAPEMPALAEGRLRDREGHFATVDDWDGVVRALEQ